MRKTQPDSYRHPAAIAIAPTRTIKDYVQIFGSAGALVGLVWLCELSCAAFEKDLATKWTLIGASTLVCLAAAACMLSFLEGRKDG